MKSGEASVEKLSGHSQNRSNIEWVRRQPCLVHMFSNKVPLFYEDISDWSDTDPQLTPDSAKRRAS